MAFAKTLTLFCNELRETFPELKVAIDRALQITPAAYWASWSKALDILLKRDTAELFGDRKGFLIGAVRMTPALWAEISDATQLAIWRYLRTLLLEAVMELNVEGIDADAAQAIMAILTEERLDTSSLAGGGATHSMAAGVESDGAEAAEEAQEMLSPLMDRLKEMFSKFTDASGAAAFADVPMPEIPEHLRNGRIAKLAEELAKQFNPAEFGIDPTMLEGDNVEDVLKRLATLYQQNPEMLMRGAKAVAERIKTKILGGSLDRDALVAEAKEFVELFKNHPLFKDGIEKLNGFLGPGGLAEMFQSAGAGAGAPSERLRAVQERLRKKMAARRGR